MSAAGTGARVGLEGNANFRDVGRYRTASGERVATGVLYRSGSLDRLTPGDVETLRGHGVRTIIDLRREAERAATPAWVEQAGITVTALPVGTSVAHLNSVSERMLNGEITDFSVRDMVDIYLTVLASYPDVFGTVARLVARSAGATVVHCTAGKDRTGVAVALLLSFLGVDDETVALDYAGSQLTYSDPLLADLEGRFEAFEVDLERVRTFFDANPAVMLGLLDGLRRDYGSAEGYLAGPAGVSAADLAALRARLLASGTEAPEGAR